MNLTKDILEQLIREQIEATLQEKASVVLQEEIDAVLQEYTDAELEAIAAGEAAAAEAGEGHIATGHERIGTGEEVKPPPPTKKVVKPRRRVQGSGATMGHPEMLPLEKKLRTPASDIPMPQEGFFMKIAKSHLRRIILEESQILLD